MHNESVTINDNSLISVNINNCSSINVSNLKYNWSNLEFYWNKLDCNRLSVTKLDKIVVDSYYGSADTITDLTVLPALRTFIAGYGFVCKVIFPPSIVTIKLGGYNQPLDTWNCPALKKLKHLDLSVGCSKFNQSLDLLYYCDNLKTLKLGNSFTHDIDMLPNSVQYLELGDKFNCYTVWPDSLIELKISKAFTYPLDNLPITLTRLTFGNESEQSVDNLPITFTPTFGGCFN